MGFYINSTNQVCVDHSVKDFGETTSGANPSYDFTLCKVGPMKVTSIFKRYSYDGKGKPIGDNCPWIYGVKRKQNLTVSLGGVKPLVEPFKEILIKYASECQERGIKFDVVIAMPSSHRIADIIASRAANVLGDIPVYSGAFQKADGLQILGQMNRQGIPQGAKVNIINAIHKAHASSKPFSLSDVKTEYRQFVHPVSLIPGTYNWRCILLVDDLFSTGQTLISAKNALREVLGNETHIESLCLFSPLNGRIRQRKKISNQRKRNRDK